MNSCQLLNQTTHTEKFEKKKKKKIEQNKTKKIKVKIDDESFQLTRRYILFDEVPILDV